MTMQLITAPELEPVTLADARSFLRIDTSADDEILQKLLTTAREMVETRTGLALITQSWQLKIARWPRSGRLALYRFPVQMIEKVTARDSALNLIEIDPSEMHLQLANRPHRLCFAKRGNSSDIIDITVDFTAGFGSTPDKVPEALKQAILVLCGNLYENRIFADCASNSSLFPPACERLMGLWRQISL